MNPIALILLTAGLALAAFVFAHIGRRKVAINATLTPLETSHGTESLDPDAAITFINAVVKKGSDDRHLAATNAQADIPYGVLLNDMVGSDEAGAIKKVVAIFGLWSDSLPCVSDGSSAIAANDKIVASVASPGKVRKMPTTAAQTFLVIGRARFAVAATVDEPVSIVHNASRELTNP